MFCAGERLKIPNNMGGVSPKTVDAGEPAPQMADNLPATGQPKDSFSASETSKKVPHNEWAKHWYEDPSNYASQPIEHRDSNGELERIEIVWKNGRRMLIEKNGYVYTDADIAAFDDTSMMRSEIMYSGFPDQSNKNKNKKKIKNAVRRFDQRYISRDVSRLTAIPQNWSVARARELVNIGSQGLNERMSNTEQLIKDAPLFVSTDDLKKVVNNCRAGIASYEDAKTNLNYGNNIFKGIQKTGEAHLENKINEQFVSRAVERTAGRTQNIVTTLETIETTADVIGVVTGGGGLVKMAAKKVIKVAAAVAVTATAKAAWTGAKEAVKEAREDGNFQSEIGEKMIVAAATAPIDMVGAAGGEKIIELGGRYLVRKLLGGEISQRAASTTLGRVVGWTVPRAIEGGITNTVDASARQLIEQNDVNGDGQVNADDMIETGATGFVYGAAMSPLMQAGAEGIGKVRKAASKLLPDAASTERVPEEPSVPEPDRKMHAQQTGSSQKPIPTCNRNIEIKSRRGNPYAGVVIEENPTQLTLRQSDGSDVKLNKEALDYSTLKFNDNIGNIRPKLGERIAIRSHSGNWYSGRVVAEGEHTITIRYADGNYDTLRRENLDWNGLKFIDPPISESAVVRKLYPKGFGGRIIQMVEDCYLLSGIHALKKHPDFSRIIDRAVKEVPGGWMVTFGKYSDMPIFVSDKKLRGQWVREKGQWLPRPKLAADADLGDRVLEYAYGKLRKRIGNEWKGKKTYVAVEGGYGHRFVEDLTGWSRQTVSATEIGRDRGTFQGRSGRMNRNGDNIYPTFSEGTPVAKQRLREALVRKAKDPDALVLLVATPPTNARYYTDAGSQLLDSMDPEMNFPCRHEYSITDVSLNADGTIGSITVVNPHDTKTKKHILTIDQFERLFSQVFLNNAS